MIEQIKIAFQKVSDKLLSWIDALIVMLPNAIVVVVIIFLAVLLARLSHSILDRTLPRFSRNTAVNKLIQSLTKGIIFIITLIISMSILNLEKTVSSLLAGVGLAGLILGLAFKNAASNLYAGAYIVINSPINVGDLIQTGDYYGYVTKIGLRATTVRSLQGQEIVIPNQDVLDNAFLHFTLNGRRRIDLDVGISYGDDLEFAEKVTIEAIEKIPQLLKGRNIEFYYREFGDSSINFTVMYWIHFHNEKDYLRALSEGIKNIKKAYNIHGITITFPIRTLDFGIKGGQTLGDNLKETDVVAAQHFFNRKNKQ